jgi:hypothetical protein
MGNKHRDIDVDKLKEYSLEYCDECINNTNEVATSSGKILEVKNRHLPTIGYFLLHWLRREHKDFYMLKKSQFYEALKDETHPLSDTIKEINQDFIQLATDIVANEGKGIFYAKNKLGMHDKQHIENKTVDKFEFDN